MTIVFHERVGHAGRRPSPFSWRIRYALAHKGVAFAVVPTRFADVDRIAALSGQRMTPVLVDGTAVVADSWAIACHLEDQYPDQPSLFGGAIGRGLTRQLNIWSDTVLGPALRPIIAADFIWCLDAGDRRYFRQSREAAFGSTLEAYCTQPEAGIAALRDIASPLERLLTEQPFLCGAAPAYGDHLVFSVFQYARLGCPRELLAEGSALHAWRGRMIALFDGLGDRFPGYPTEREGPDGH